jgi:glycosyltransferase involved in cell wall biosynthesis
MNGLRLAVVTRRFWPLADEPEAWLADLLSGLQQRGVRPTIITAQWKPFWPCQAMFREIPLIRLPHASPGGWGTLRYMRRLGAWLRAHREQFDAVLVSRLRLDAYAALGAVRGTHLPVVIRAEGAGELGDAAWLDSNPFGGRIRRRLFSAPAIVTGSSIVHAELVAAGCAAERLRLIPPGVDADACCSDYFDPVPSQTVSSQTGENPAEGGRPVAAAGRRTAARLALSEACSDLATNPDDPVLLYIGRLHRANNATTLLQAWTRVAGQLPRAWLWLVGDGPEREAIYQRIGDEGLRQRTFLPGTFDDIGDLLHAADLLLAPTRAADVSATVIRALASGLPVIASDVGGHRELLAGCSGGLLVPPRDSNAWSSAILRLIQDDAERRQMSEEALSRASELSVSRAAGEYMALFNSLLRSAT